MNKLIAYPIFIFLFLFLITPASAFVPLWDLSERPTFFGWSIKWEELRYFEILGNFGMNRFNITQISFICFVDESCLNVSNGTINYFNITNNITNNIKLICVMLNL